MHQAMALLTPSGYDARNAAGIGPYSFQAACYCATDGHLRASRTTFEKRCVVLPPSPMKVTKVHAGTSPMSCVVGQHSFRLERARFRGMQGTQDAPHTPPVARAYSTDRTASSYDPLQASKFDRIGECQPMLSRRVTIKHRLQSRLYTNLYIEAARRLLQPRASA